VVSLIPAVSTFVKERRSAKKAGGQAHAAGQGASEPPPPRS